MKINQRSETFRKTVHLRTLLMPKMIVFVELPVSEKKKIVEEPFYDKRPETVENHNPLWLLERSLPSWTEAGETNWYTPGAKTNSRLRPPCWTSVARRPPAGSPAGLALPRGLQNRQFAVTM
jgi:hypothetical protein